MSQSHVQCISGHFHYSNVAHDLFKDNWHFVTILHDPVLRWLSHFRYDSSLGRINIPIEEFIETTRAASFGRAFVDEVTEDINKSDTHIDERIEIATERYKRFSLVGTIEDTTHFASQFKEIFGCPLEIKHLNKTNKKPSEEKLPSHIIEKIHELCEPDLRLYNQIISNN